MLLSNWKDCFFKVIENQIAASCTEKVYQPADAGPKDFFGIF